MSGERNDHDLLLRIDANLSNSIESQKSQNVRFEQHVQEDKENFDMIKRFMWMTTGAFAIINVVFAVLSRSR